MKIIVGLAVVAISLVPTAARAADDAATKLMDEGRAGTYSYSGVCPKMDKSAAKSITADKVKNVLTEGRNKILESNPANDPGQAAKSMSSVLDAAAALACQVDGPAKHKYAMKLKPPQRWIKILGAGAFLKKKDFAAPVDDYGYYLQLNGDQKGALAVLQEAVKLDPQLDDAYLHLADTQWVLKQFKKAKVNYRTYRQLHIMAHGHGTVPKYVEERLGI